MVTFIRRIAGMLLLAGLYAPGLYAQLYIPVPGDFPRAELREAWVPPDSLQLYIRIKEAMNSSRDNQDSSILAIRRQAEESLLRGYHDAAFQGCFFLGVLYIYRGEYDTAYGWLWRALTLSGQSSSTLMNLYRTLNNIGNIFQYRGDYRQAIEYYFKAIPFAEKVAATDISVADPLIRIYTSAATALLQLKEYSRALYYLDKAEVLAHRMNLVKNLPAVYVSKAIVYERMGAGKKAWAYSQQALSLATQFRMEEIEFMAMMNFGDILRENGKPREAIPYLDAALRLRGNINLYYRAGALSSLGNCYFLLKDYPRAEQHFLSAYAKAAASRIPEYMLYIHQQLAELYLRMNDYRQAYEHHHAAYLLNDSLLNKDKMEAVNLLEVKYRTAESRREVAQKQLLINEQHRKLGQKNMWIVITIAGIAVLGALLLGFFRNYRQRQRLYEEQIRNMKQEQEIELLQAMMQGEEKERIRFAHELHDGISSQLSAMKLYLDTVRVRNPALPIQEELGQMMQLLADTSTDVRKTAHNLMPDGLIRQGLEEAIRSFCTFISKGDLQVEVQTYGDLGNLESGLELSIYRAIQELVHNIVKHARATQAIVLVSNRDGILRITIEDNGTGMGQQPSEAGGIGLDSLQRRIQAMGGQLIIESGEGKGTTVYIELLAYGGKAPAGGQASGHPV